MAWAKGIVVLSVAQRAALERLVRAYTTPQHIAERARIVLMSADGKLNVAQAVALEVDPQRVRRWRVRWAACQPAIAAAEADDFILYDSATGALYYDADGNGPGEAIQFATLTGSPDALDHTDFEVV